MNTFNLDAFRRLDCSHLIPSLRGNKAACRCECTQILLMLLLLFRPFLLIFLEQTMSIVVSI